MTTLLVSSAGRRVELIRLFRRAAQRLGHSLVVYATDADPSWSPACQMADVSVRVSRCAEPEFIPRMLEICGSNDIRCIIPTIDTELIPYAEHVALFREQDVDVIVPPLPFVRMARDKALTAALLAENGVGVPRTWEAADALAQAEKLPYPTIVKPRDGSCSKGIAKVANAAELMRSVSPLVGAGWIVQEMCRGQEFTINAFFDAGACVSCIPHARRLVRDGEVCFAETIRVPAFRAVADTLARVFPDLYGPVCFQAFLQPDGRAQVFEINARFGGGYPICDEAGGTHATWILQKLEGQTPLYHDDWAEGVRMLRYDSAVFLPPQKSLPC